RLPLGPYDHSHSNVFRLAFEAAYQKLYGRTIDGIEIEVLSWTLTISAPVPDPAPALAAPGSSTLPEPAMHQSFLDPVSGGRVDVPVFQRGDLNSGNRISGPALVTEDQTTTVITSLFDAEIDARGYIVMTRREEQDDD
ncbi:MAG: hydantoinase/oxoprolinase family protein, partial [Desulfobulbaceae bacterium]|nr:hydantoinase/oxoprolinase family protein [Desulfobulbaceae bacterium]